jgi:two-component system, NarL family, sensor histidine kinase EvgS
LGQLLQIGLSSINEAERTAIRDRWLTVNYQSGVSMRSVLGYVVPIGGALLLALGVFWLINRRLQREIVARKKTEAELERKRKQAEEATMAKARYLATMSHEVRTPMQGVLAAAEVLNKTALDPMQKRMSGIIQEAVSSLVQLLNGVLDDAKLGAGKVRVHATVVDVRKITMALTELFATTAANKGIALDVDVDETVARAHRLDGALLRQVLSNLVSNAVKFTRAGKVGIRISALGDHETNQATNQATNQRLVIAVTDTGPGMTSTELAHLFEPFQQGIASRDVGMEGLPGMVGSGLGLSIAKRMTEAMGGVLAVASEVGRGSTFTVTLDAPLADAVELAKPLSLATTEAPSIRVLLVEDDRLLQMLYEEQFTELAMAVEIVSDAESALQRWREGSFDIIVTDNSLGGMTGSELARLIRDEEAAAGADAGANTSARTDTSASTQPRRRRTPILGVSGSVLSADREICLQSGMDAMLQKPVALNELQEAILQLIAPQDTLRHGNVSKSIH